MEEQSRKSAASRREKTVLRKNVLAQYVDLVQELKEVEHRIEDTKDKMRKLEEEGEVTDTVKGGEGGIQHYTITGFPSRDYSRMKTLLLTRQAIQNSLKSEIEQSINEVQEFISHIEDSRDRRIVTMRVIDRMSWRQIARNLGGPNTEDAARMAFERILKRENRKKH